MAAGVTLKDPQTTYIEDEVVIGKDSLIGPNTHLLGRTVIGERCRVDGNAYLTDARLGDDVHLRFGVVITDSVLDKRVEVGPFSHLRPGTHLKASVHIGNFVEVKNSVIGESTKASHLTYIGDASVGSKTNIGAGTITCNYDGFDKYRTKIGDRVQVGSDTQLVAPVAVGDDAYIGSGTTITQDVPPGALALSRTPQKNIPGWVGRFRAKRRGK
jgi:bifunctional UDP-N-acetylglucosamine pyrophosphorylase/glucosamine-1-phosphate N-acetyltransferase